MAKNSTREGSTPRRLSELLNEKQEPFVLEIYLLERGYRIRKSLELDGGIIGCCSTTSNHNFNNSSSKQSLKKSSTSLSSIARTFVNKLVSKKKQRIRRKQNEKVVESAGNYSSTSGSTALSNYTWFESETDEKIISMSSPVKKETIRDDDKSASDRMMIEWRFVEDIKQCSPDSVLDELDFQAIPVYNNVKKWRTVEPRIRFQRKVSEDAIVSASLWELLVQLRDKPKPQQGRRKPFPEYMNSKKALQQNRQLMFDCVREVVESEKQQYNSSNRTAENGLKMGPEEIGKFICRNLKEWGKLSSDETNIKQVLKMDLLEDRWGGSKLWKREIVAEIGNCIIDDIIAQIINDMIDH